MSEKLFTQTPTVPDVNSTIEVMEGQFTDVDSNLPTMLDILGVVVDPIAEVDVTASPITDHTGNGGDSF